MFMEYLGAIHQSVHHELQTLEAKLARSCNWPNSSLSMYGIVQQYSYVTSTCRLATGASDFPVTPLGINHAESTAVCSALSNAQTGAPTFQDPPDS